MAARPIARAVTAMLLAVAASVCFAADGDSAGAKFLQDERAAHPVLHRLWRDIERSVPKRTHLSRLTFDKGVVQVDLAWRSASEALQGIQAMKALVDAALVGDIQTDGELGIQHFTIQGTPLPNATTGNSTSFVPGKDFEVGVSQLKLRVEEAIATHAQPGCTFVMSVPYRSHDDSAFERVTLKTRLRCLELQLRLVLADLESGNPTLFLDEVRISKRVGALEPGSTESSVYMDVGFDLVGYIDAPGR